jgi:hypothetical protein
MRIFHSASSDSMLLDSRDNLVELHKRLIAFLSSPARELEVLAQQDGSPAPYEAFLPGLRVRKGSGPIVLSKLPNGWLSLEGSEDNLRRYASYFHFPPDQEAGHHHPENCNLPGYMANSSLNLIIESDSSWGEEGAA